MLLAPTMSIASTEVSVPPHEQVAPHSPWWRQTQPSARRMERGSTEITQRRTWENYCAELERLWNEFRLSGYTPEAWQDYQASAEQAKRRYIYGDSEPLMTQA